MPFQRYGTMAHPAISLIRMAVFLSAATTLLGFGAMWGADHSLLRSTGITAFLGIAYSMLGAFLILPTLLGRIRRAGKPVAPAAGLRDRVLARYRHMEAYPRLFARFKTRLDPMFRELEGILRSADGVRSSPGHRHRLRGAGVLAAGAVPRGAGAGRGARGRARAHCRHGAR